MEIWAGTQGPYGVAAAAAAISGVAPAIVTVHVPLLGGGFVRRSTNDYAMDAVDAVSCKPDVARAVIEARAQMTDTERFLVAQLIRYGASPRALEPEDAVRP